MRRGLRWLVRILLTLLVLVVLAVVGGYWYERPLLRTGTGYAAHNACAVTKVAGRQNPETDLPPNPLVPYLRSSVADDRAKTTILGALAGQTAWYTEGFGCTIGSSKPSLGTASPVSSAGNPLSSAAVPGSDPSLDDMLANAFGDDLAPDAKAALGTRAIVVVHNGQLMAERYAEGFDASTPQLGWSMTKSVANLLVGRAVLAGKVAITDDNLLPQWTDQRSAITIDDLERMTSGLTWDETYDLGTPITRMLYGEDDMAAYTASQPLAHEPGSYLQYSSGSTNLLCSIVRAKVGGSADWPRTELFAPLGLSSAVLEPDAAGNPVCSSYLWATPRDWAALGQFALQDGVWNGQRLLPEGWMAQSTVMTPVDTSEEPGYAAGWWTNKNADGSIVNPDLPPDAYWMQGHDGQRVFVVPSANLVVVRLGFSPEIESANLRVTNLVQNLTAIID